MVQSDSTWKNKTVLITGASRGLGADCAHYFGKKGARLLLIARSESEIQSIARQYANALPLAADLGSLEAIAKLGKQIESSVDLVDVAIHCAGGGLGLKDPVLSGPQLNQLFQLNVTAGVEINKFIIPAMKKAQRGNILHIGSIASTDAVGSVGYNTCKAALAAYVRSLGKVLASDGIIVSGLLAGGFFSSGGAMDRLQKNNPAAYEDFLQKRIPRKKFGEFNEMIPLIEFLASPMAGMMCGCLVPMDGGEGSSYVPVDL